MTPREPVSPGAVDSTSSETPNDVDGWLFAIRHALSMSDGQPLALAKRALQVFPNEAMILHLAGLAALVEKKPKE